MRISDWSSDVCSSDLRGTREYNLALGDRRANPTKYSLASRGVDASRMTTISYGKERPVAMGSDEASWAPNRHAVTAGIGRSDAFTLPECAAGSDRIRRSEEHGGGAEWGRAWRTCWEP